MKLSDYEKRTVIPAIIRVRISEGLYTTPKKALEIFEKTMEEKGGPKSWAFVMWKREIVNKASNPLIRL